MGADVKDLPPGYTLDPVQQTNKGLPPGYALDQGPAAEPVSYSPMAMQDYGAQFGAPIDTQSFAPVAQFAKRINHVLPGIGDLLLKAGSASVGGNKALMTLATGGSMDEAIAQINDSYVQGMPLTDALDRTLSSLAQELGAPNVPGMPPGPERDVVNLAADALTAYAGLKPVPGRNVATPGGATAELAGFGSATPAPLAANLADVPAPVLNAQPGSAGTRAPQGPLSREAKRRLAVQRRRGDIAAAGYKLDDAGNVAPDPVQQQAIKQGIEPRIVAQVSQASPEDKIKLGEMLDIVEGGLENKTYGDFNLPRSVLGDSMYGRFHVVDDINKQAGARVAVESEALKNIPFDGDAFTTGPVRQFFEELAGYGVKISRDGKVKFRGSRFEGAPGAQRIIRKTLKRMYDTGTKSLHDAHRLKEFIDEMVDEYGRSSGGLSGKADYVVKSLRHNLNQFIREGSTDARGISAYADANDIYSETIDVLNDADRLVGRNNAVDPRSLSRVARKAVSNYATGDQVMDMLVDLDDLATKYGGEFADDLPTQVSVVQTIEKLFPSARPPASFSGDIDKVADYYYNAVMGNKASLMAGAFDEVKKRLGKSEYERLMEMVKTLRGLSEPGT